MRPRLEALEAVAVAADALLEARYKNLSGRHRNQLWRDLSEALAAALPEKAILLRCQQCFHREQDFPRVRSLCIRHGYKQVRQMDLACPEYFELRMRGREG